MTRPPVLKPDEVESLLKRLGFQAVRQRGSHRQFRHPDGRATTLLAPDPAAPDHERGRRAYGTPSGQPSITLNRRDFIRLHHERPEHDGIIVCTPEPDANAHARGGLRSLRDFLARVADAVGPE